LQTFVTTLVHETNFSTFIVLFSFPEVGLNGM